MLCMFLQMNEVTSVNPDRNVQQDKVLQPEKNIASESKKNPRVVQTIQCTIITKANALKIQEFLQCAVSIVYTSSIIVSIFFIFSTRLTETGVSLYTVLKLDQTKVSKCPGEGEFIVHSRNMYIYLPYQQKSWANYWSSYVV